jgi:hypothetical protein
MHAGQSPVRLYRAEAGVDTNYHQSTHGRPAEDHIKYRAYFATKLRRLIESLANTQDMDGNTL